MIQIGGVYRYASFCQKEGMLLQRYRDRYGRCIAILSKVSGSRVDLTLLTNAEPRGKKGTFFWQILGGGELLESACEECLSAARGA